MVKKETVLLKIIYLLEGFCVKILFGIFKLLGIRISSFICGAVAMIIGPLTFPTFLAFRNLKKAIPELSFKKRFQIVLKMWNNLGSYIGEYANIYNMKKGEIFKYVSIGKSTKENIKKLKDSKKGAILFSAHIGNWEAGLKALEDMGVKNLKAVYRSLNNKCVDEIASMMRKSGNIEIIPKGHNSALKLFRELKKGAKIVILVDQRLGDGIEIPFFNQPAKTVDSVGIFALKCDIPIYPIRIIRKGMGSDFELELSDELKVKKIKNLTKNVKNIMVQVNQVLEKWIRQYPEQWFWVHNRWRL